MLPACKSRQLAETVRRFHQFASASNVAGWQLVLPGTEVRKVPDCGTQSPDTRDACATQKLTGGSPHLLRTLFERVRFAAQECECFAGEMEGTGDQDSLAHLLCSRDRFGNGWSDGVGE